MSTPAIGIARTERYTYQSLHWGVIIIPLVLGVYVVGVRHGQSIGGALGAIAASVVALSAGLVVLHTGLRDGGALGPSGWDRWFYAPARRRIATVVWAAASIATCAAAAFLIPPPVEEKVWFVDSLLVSVVAAALAYPVFGLTTRRAPAYLVAVGYAAVWLLASTIVQPDGGRFVLAVPIMVWAVMFVGMNSMLINMLRTTQELDRLRHSAAQLAVAEERLRFARDLHDVIGRTLSAIALKAELGVAQAEQDRPEAAATMREVQAVATDALHEMRNLVRGYREADLVTELAGARSLLEAVGITVSTIVEPGALPPPVTRCLAWVVREGTTNVLRHAAATTVELALVRDADGVTLTLTNDGVGKTAPKAGSGLGGLAERLEEVGGSLSSEVRDGHWVLTARVDAAVLASLDTAGSQS